MCKRNKIAHRTTTIIWKTNLHIFCVSSLECVPVFSLVTNMLQQRKQQQGFQNDYTEEWPSSCGAKRYLRRLYSDRHRLCLDRAPILKWLPSYKLNYLFHDFVAGFTVGLTAIPQGIAYAVVAGLPPQYGLYSGFMGSFVYLLLGSCKDITIGKYIFYAWTQRSHTCARTSERMILKNCRLMTLKLSCHLTNDRRSHCCCCCRVSLPFRSDVREIVLQLSNT